MIESTSLSGGRIDNEVAHAVASALPHFSALRILTYVAVNKRLFFEQTTANHTRLCRAARGAASCRGFMCSMQYANIDADGALALVAAIPTCPTLMTVQYVYFVNLFLSDTKPHLLALTRMFICAACHCVADSLGRELDAPLQRQLDKAMLQNARLGHTKAGASFTPVPEPCAIAHGHDS